MWWMLAWSLATAGGLNTSPAMDVSGGIALFSPLNRPLAVNPGLDGQFDVSEILPDVPWLGASAGVQTGVFFYRNCPDCMPVGTWGLGVGPGVFTPFVDANLFMRVVGFGRGVSVRPALQVSAKFPSLGANFSGHRSRFTSGGLPFELRGVIGVEGARYPDLRVGLRGSIPLDKKTGRGNHPSAPEPSEDGTPGESPTTTAVSTSEDTPDVRTSTVEPQRTRPRSRPRKPSCEEGDTREKAGSGRQQLAFSEPISRTPEFELDWGRWENLDNESKDALGKIKQLVGSVLSIKNSALSLRNINENTASGMEIIERTQDAISNAGLVDFTVPLTLTDLPEMLATNYLEIGQQAVTALTRKLDAHKRTYLHDVRAWYLLERTEFECYEIEVCEDGDWTDGGWFPDPATVVRHEPRKVNINVRVSTSRPNVASQLRGVLRMLDIAMSRLTYWRRDAFEAGDNPCAAADAFDPGPVAPTPEVLEVDAEPEPSGPSKEDCEEWRRQRAGLQREYDSFRGSYSTGLLIDQLGKDKEHAQYQSRYYEQFVEDISAMIQRDNDRVADGGTPNESFARDLRDDLAKYEAKRDEWIEKQQELDQSMTALRDKEVLGRTRMPEIQQEIAELDARLAECE